MKSASCRTALLLVSLLLLFAEQVHGQRSAVRPAPKPKAATLDERPREDNDKTTKLGAPVDYSSFRELRRDHDRIDPVRALEDHRYLLEESFTDDAREWITALSDRKLLGHLRAIDHRAEMFSVPLDRDVSSSQIVELRQRYIELITQQIEKSIRSRLTRLSDHERGLLVDYARKQGAQADSVEQLNVSSIEAWIRYEQATNEALLNEWRVLDTSNSRAVTALEHFRGRLQSGADPHEQAYALRTLQDKISSVAGGELKRRGIESWTYRSNHVGQALDEIWQFLDFLEKPLPGGTAELVYFLDRVKDAGPADSLTEAWTAPGRSAPRFLDHVEIDRFLSEFRGKTLIMIGHMEHRGFLMHRRDGLAPLVIDLPNLLERAQKLDVFLVPIGCSSADQGAWFGFTRPIDTSEILPMLRAVPATNATVGDLMTAIGLIGVVTVDLSGLLSQGYVDVAARKKIIVGGEHVEANVVVMRIPWVLIQSESGVMQTVQSFDDAATTWAKKNRPLYDRGVLRTWWSFYRRYPSLTLLGSGLLLLFAAPIWDRLRAAIWPRRELQSRAEWLLRWTLGIVASILLISAPLRLAFDVWRDGNAEMVVIVGLLLIGGLFKIVSESDVRKA
jgi:hypothetical protein